LQSANAFFPITGNESSQKSRLDRCGIGRHLIAEEIKLFSEQHSAPSDREPALEALLRPARAS